MKPVLTEINEINGTDYQMKDVYFNFEPEVMSNAQGKCTDSIDREAQTRQIEINIIMSLAQTLDDETELKLICEQLDIDYQNIKDKLPKKRRTENIDSTKCIKVGL